MVSNSRLAKRLPKVILSTRLELDNMAMEVPSGTCETEEPPINVARPASYAGTPPSGSILGTFMPSSRPHLRSCQAVVRKPR